MNERQIRAILPRASQAFIDANRSTQSSKPEPAVHHGTDGKTTGKTIHPVRRLVSITSFRVRQCDPDNLIGKYFLDALRYAGVIHDDREADITYQISQRKVEKEEQEKTLIEIT